MCHLLKTIGYEFLDLVITTMFRQFEWRIICCRDWAASARTSFLR